MSSPCALSQNIPIQCRQSVGGIKQVYITEFANVASYTASSGSVTALTLATGSNFQTYSFRKQTGDLNEKWTINDPNGTVVYEPTVTLQLSKALTNTRNELAQVAQNDVVIGVLDNNGQYWLCGLGNGMYLSAGSAETGKNFTDLSGYKLTFQGFESVPMYSCSGSIITAYTH